MNIVRNISRIKQIFHTKKILLNVQYINKIACEHCEDECYRLSIVLDFHIVILHIQTQIETQRERERHTPFYHIFRIFNRLSNKL